MNERNVAALAAALQAVYERFDTSFAYYSSYTDESMREFAAAVIAESGALVPNAVTDEAAKAVLYDSFEGANGCIERDNPQGMREALARVARGEVAA